MRYLWVVCTLLLSACQSVTVESSNESSAVKVFTSEESFEDVVENIKMAIIERGLLVSGTLHVSKMLNRTATDLGFSQLFLKAESVGFCSALMSHKMAQAAVENISICPFTIAVYEKQAQPEQVYVAYRPPYFAGDGQQVTKEIVNLLEGIIEDSI